MSGKTGWEELGSVAPDELEDTRLQLHWAAQLLGSFAEARVEPEDDFGHLALTVASGARRLVGARGRGGHVVALALAAGEVVVETPDGGSSTFALEGRTLAEALAWLDESTRGEEEGALALSPPDDMPEHGVGKGEPFALDLAAAAELERWFVSFAGLLEEERAKHAGAAPLRLWPHHFDLATLIVLDPDKSSEEARSIGLGLSPGDGAYDVPYLYVTPWPYPSPEGLPVLEAGGRWHVEGWVGATLSSLRLATAADGEEQEHQVREFLASALPAALSLLDA